MEVVCKRVITRVRHRPLFALTLAVVLTFLVVSLQWGSMTPFSTHRSAEAQGLPDCGSDSTTATIWPWCGLQKYDYGRHIDPVGDEPTGRDPAETYPLFRELETAPDPLHAEFVAWHGDDYKAPPKPKYKGGHSPEERKAAASKLDKALGHSSGKVGKKVDDDTAKDDTEDETKNEPNDTDLPRPIADPFPLLSKLDRAGLRQLLPAQHNTETRTPLLIGFTRNWPLLLQCVASYMAAGWPARDIYVVENTGTMGANRAGRLSLQNPFFLNHTQLVDTLGVNVIETPTLFTFAQLQNFYLYTAQHMGWQQYFWSHQDVVVFSEKGYEDANAEDSLAASSSSSSSSSSGGTNINTPFASSPRSLHHRALGTLKILTQRTDAASGGGGAPTWATHFFNYDRLTLVNVPAYLAVGGWDTHISFYAGDCDMYLRLKWAGYWQGMLLPVVGRIYDVAGVLDDLGALFHAPGVDASVGGWGAPGARKRRGEEEEEEEEEEENNKASKASKAGQRQPPLSPQEALAQQMADLVYVVEQMHRAKNDGNEAIADALEPLSGSGGSADASAIEVSDRNAWQRRQQGGQGEPFYRDPEGFEAGLQKHIAVGRQVYADKWGHRGCDLHDMGIRTEDAWHLEHDWDNKDGSGSDGGGW
ncbi:MAG: hypothetical protein STHCBS139747_003033 [Sporothrix thermara]